MSSGPSGAESRITAIIGGISTAFNIISAAWVLAIAALILRDVVGRQFFDAPLYGTTEIVTNSILSILLLQLPLSILKRNALRTTIVFDKVGIKARGVIDALSYFLAGLLFLAIAIGSWPNMIEAWEIQEAEGSGIITIPVYPIRTLVIVVSVMCIAVCALLIWQSLTRPAEHLDAYHAPEGE